MQGDTLRIATLHTDLSRDGPALLLRDILKGDDPQIAALCQVMADVRPDIVVLQDVDFDLNLHALRALRDSIARDGPLYPHLFARQPNSGLFSGLDMDGDGRLGEPEDAMGYGEFAGEGGMAILSRWPMDEAGAQDFTQFLWRDLPGALLPLRADGTPFPSRDVQAQMRLASVGQWVVPVQMPDATLHLLTFHANTPVFDGPQDRNGRRNHDELRFWLHYLDGALGPAPKERFVLLGDANQDPQDGEGIKDAIRALLADPRLQDPAPRRSGPAPHDPSHQSDPRHDTVAWPMPVPGHLRVSYILPSSDWHVVASGVHWPDDATPQGAIAAAASRHRMVWVDLALP